MKKCVGRYGCGKIKPLSDFYTEKRNADGHQSTCKDCLNQQKRRKIEDTKVKEGDFCIVSGYKQCTSMYGCGKIKPIDEFVKCDTCTGDGHRGICIDCYVKTKKIKDKENKQKNNEYKNKWLKDNPEKRAEALFMYKVRQCKEGDFSIVPGNKQCKGKYGCGEIKPIDEFVENANRKDGHNSICIVCDKKRKILLKESMSEKDIEKTKQRKRQWYKKNKETINKKQKNMTDEERQYKYEQRQKKHKKKMKEDPIYALKVILRSRFNKIMRKLKTGENKIRGELAFEYLQCSIEDLREHIEAQFYPHPETGEEMTWENHGVNGWHVDHIIPYDSITDDQDTKQIKKVCYYENLQPMWAEYNRNKSSLIITEFQIEGLKKGIKI